MKDILDEIIAWKRVEVERFKSEMPAKVLYAKVEQLLDVEVPSMSDALLDSSNGIIAEFKRRSPSLGWIKQEGRADDIPLAYQKAGAAAVSILTDEKYFGGSDEFIVTARHSGVRIPVLYKNFVVDEYQLFQARKVGASAVLLIAAALDKNECKSLIAIANEIGLEVLLEMHSEEEATYIDLCQDAVVSGRVMCGVNNRNLGTFVTDVNNSFRLAELLPKEAIKVSESGISNTQTIQQLRQAGFRGFLIGERFMKAEEPATALSEFCKDLSK